MRISKQISGNARRRDSQRRQGRGEYEICDEFEGLRPPDLFNRKILLDFPGVGLTDTWTMLRLQGGKRRIRIAPAATVKSYPHRQVAVALLLPEPSRSEPQWGDGTPVLRSEQYGIAHLELNDVELLGTDRVRLRVSNVQIANNYQQETIPFAARFENVQRLWAARASFEAPIADLIQAHEAMVRSGNPLGVPGEQLIRDLQREVAATGSDYGILGNSPTTDVLPALLQIIGGIHTEPAQDIDSIPPGFIEIRRREVKQWRRWAAARGAASARFRREVRAAYRATCVVCGLCFPPLGDDSNPGVDAAHILPWAEFDMDHISNGLCLCKLHHWAFDEGLIEIAHDGSNFVVSVPEAAEDRMLEVPGYSLAFLRQAAGLIPVARLPADAAQQPRPEFLQRLREILSAEGQA